MLIRYKNGRFHLGQISLTIPDDVLLDMDPDLVHGGLALRGEDDNDCMDLYLDHHYTDSFETMAGFLSGLFEDPPEDILLAGIEPFALKGLSGYKASYTSQRDTFLELRFPLTHQGEEPLTFVVNFNTHHPVDPRAILSHPSVREILQSIQVEDSILS